MNRDRNGKASQGRAGASTKFGAVSVEPSADCCEAVKGLAGRRVLAAAAPRLPLEACSQPATCRCRYRKYGDRRDGSEGRRLEGNSMRSVLYAGRERRRSPDRRGDD